MSRSRTILRPRRLGVVVATTLATVVTAVVVSSQSSQAAIASTADWQLQGNRASAVPGAPALTDLGTGNKFVTTTVDGTAGRKVLSYPLGNGLQVSPTTGLINESVYSVVILYKPTTTNGYQRILDFNDGVGETGLYSRDQVLYAYPQASGTATPITNTAFHQVVLTRTASKIVTGYVDGVQQLSFTDSTDQWVASGDSIRFLRESQSENGAGQVARIRLYKSALTKAQVSSLDRLPANAADVAAALSDAPDPVLHGGLLAYTATVTNNGPASSVATSVQFTLPTGVTVVGSSPSAGTCAAPAGRIVTCSLGTIAPSGTATALVVVNAPTATGSVTGSATASTSTADSNSNNNSASTTTRVR